MNKVTLNSRGFSHFIVPIVIVACVAVIGTYIVVKGHAEACPVTTTTHGILPGSGCKTLPLQQSALSMDIATGNKDIALRFTELNSLKNLIGVELSLTAADKTTLLREDSNDVTGLTALKKVLDVATTVPKVNAYITEITNNFQVEDEFAPKVSFVEQTDAQSATEALLTREATTYTSELKSAPTAAKLAAAESELATMNLNINAAKENTNSLRLEVLAVTAAKWTANPKIYVGDPTQLHLAQTDIDLAMSAAKIVTADL